MFQNCSHFLAFNFVMYSQGNNFSGVPTALFNVMFTRSGQSQFVLAYVLLCKGLTLQTIGSLKVFQHPFTISGYCHVIMWFNSQGIKFCYVKFRFNILNHLCVCTKTLLCKLQENEEKIMLQRKKCTIPEIYHDLLYSKITASNRDRQLIAAKKIFYLDLF